MIIYGYMKQYTSSLMDILARLNNWDFKRIILADFDAILAEEKSARMFVLNEEKLIISKRMLQFKSCIPIISFYTKLFDKLIVSLSKSRNITPEQYRETHSDQIKSIMISFYKLTLNMLNKDFTLSQCIHELFDGTKATPKNKIYSILFNIFCHSLDTEYDRVTDVDMLRFYVDDELDHIMTIEEYFLNSDGIKCDVYKKLVEIEKLSVNGFFDDCFFLENEYNPFITMYNIIHTIIGNKKYIYKKVF